MKRKKRPIQIWTGRVSKIGFRWEAVFFMSKFLTDKKCPSKITSYAAVLLDDLVHDSRA
jgi:hypothetical protein